MDMHGLTTFMRTGAQHTDSADVITQYNKALHASPVPVQRPRAPTGRV
jgi:hypothetical protein